MMLRELKITAGKHGVYAVSSVTLTGVLQKPAVVQSGQWASIVFCHAPP